MNSEAEEKLKNERLGAFVRLSETEFQQLSKDSTLLKWSVPRILRESYFKRLPMKLTFDKEGEKQFLTEWRRIGNNINQLAKTANSGDLVPATALKAIQEQLEILYRYVMRADGIHKNT